MLSNKANAALAKIRQSDLTDVQKEQAVQELVTKEVVPQFGLNYPKQTSARLTQYLQSKLDEILK